MAKVYIMVGPPASGKTTVAKGIDAVLVSSDDIVDELWPGFVSMTDVFRTAFARVIENLRAGKDVVLDATNCYAWQRRNAIQRLGPYAEDGIEAVVLATPLSLCISRHRVRRPSLKGLKVGLKERAIASLYEALEAEPVRLQEGFTAVTCLTPEMATNVAELLGA